ncbi:hypothetical protein D3C80_1666930 [compost metagenome]
MRVIQLPQAAVQRDGFTAAGRASDQDHALRARQSISILRQRRLAHTQLFQRQLLAFGLQDPQHHFLTVQCRQGGDAHRVTGVIQLYAELPILRQAALGDIQLPHDLQPGDKGGGKRERR